VPQNAVLTPGLCDAQLSAAWLSRRTDPRETSKVPRQPARYCLPGELLLDQYPDQQYSMRLGVRVRLSESWRLRQSAR
jgi:hypothetical protein